MTRRRTESARVTRFRFGFGFGLGFGIGWNQVRIKGKDVVKDACQFDWWAMVLCGARLFRIYVCALRFGDFI